MRYEKLMKTYSHHTLQAIRPLSHYRNIRKRSLRKITIKSFNTHVTTSFTLVIYLNAENHKFINSNLSVLMNNEVGEIPLEFPSILMV